MIGWLREWFAAAREVLVRAPAPDAALPADAKRELERWDAETVARYRAEHGGEAPPDAPHVDPNGI